MLYEVYQGLKLPLEEMGLVHISDYFYKNKHFFNENPDAPYWQRKGWDHVRNYILSIRKTYDVRDNMEDLTYLDILKKEEIFYDKYWEKLDPVIKIAVETLFRSIDSNPSILNEKEKTISR
jgi:hypothetical protein